MFVAIVAIGLGVNGCIFRQNDQEVRRWADTHGYTVQKMERWYIGHPWVLWRRKGDDIIQADLMRNGISRRSYFRINWFWGTTQRWEDGSAEAD